MDKKKLLEIAKELLKAAQEGKFEELDKALPKEARKQLASTAQHQKLKDTDFGLKDPNKGHSLGINKPMSASKPGISVQGSHIRAKSDPVIPLKVAAKDRLQALKQAPKPSLPQAKKQEPATEPAMPPGGNRPIKKPIIKRPPMVQKAKIDENKSIGDKAQVRQERSAIKEKGVHQIIPKHIPGKGISHGSSVTKPDLKINLKPRHESKLQELKAMPKPNLPKSEMAKEEIKKQEVTMDNKKMLEIAKDLLKSAQDGKLQEELTKAEGKQMPAPEAQGGIKKEESCATKKMSKDEIKADLKSDWKPKFKKCMNKEEKGTECKIADDKAQGGQISGKKA